MLTFEIIILKVWMVLEIKFIFRNIHFADLLVLRINFYFWLFWRLGIKIRINVFGIKYSFFKQYYEKIFDIICYKYIISKAMHSRLLNLMLEVQTLEMFDFLWVNCFPNENLKRNNLIMNKLSWPLANSLISKSMKKLNFNN